MSLKLSYDISEIRAGEILPSLEVLIQDIDNQLEYNHQEVVTLRIFNVQTRTYINKIVATPIQGTVIFSNIILIQKGIYNFQFSSLDMMVTKKIKVIPSNQIIIKSSIERNTLIQNMPSQFPLKIKALDIYGNSLNPEVKTTFRIKSENKNIQLFGEVFYFDVSVKFIDGRHLFTLNNKLAPSLEFKLGNTYIFKTNELSKDFKFYFSSISDGTHNGGEIYKEGSNSVGDRLSITIMRNTPSRLFYFSSKYSNMGKDIKVDFKINNPEYILMGSQSLFLKNLVIPVIGKLFIYFLYSSTKDNTASILVEVVKKYYGDIDKYNYYDYSLDYLLQSSVYTEKIKDITNVSFQPRVNNLVPRESGLTESINLKYKKDTPQELSSIPLNVDNSKGGTTSKLFFNPRIRPSFSSSNNMPISIINSTKMGLTSSTLTNMINQNVIQSGLKSFVVNDVLSLSDIIKKKKIDNQPTSDPLKSNVITID